ncbi:ABC transporter ATP-binding protein [Nonomuraea longispora]|uniref:ABC-type quaternary amine transporter n=1 Tax=Nonomuraea longispora TaxID=1848320 RepID=A0A4R4N2E2_9ACTN|nr:ABC transporter ATP-binding protein [Nonomuraea longispora]TDC02004.1 ABC transporter ATP-binding protein [Nonomuraea longispora]
MDISIEGISKTFGETTALESVDLSVPSGRLATLLGASGCGKTTLLRIVAGFETADTGAIRFGERDIAKVPVWKRRIGFVFQSYALWPHMTVAENVAYGLRLRKLSKEAVADKVAAGLAMVGLTGRERHRPGQLSGGQQQRVALARALALEPDVLLMDEPLSNLDARLRVEMRREIRRIQQETGITAVYVTHDQDEALEISDLVAVMNGGRVEQIGAPEDVYERPGTTFVASFVGSVTLLRGQVTDDGELALPSGGKVGFGRPLGQAGAAVHVALRPEDLRIVENGQAQFTGKVVRSSFQGSSRESVAELPGGELLSFEHRRPLPTGATVGLAADRFTVIGQDTGVA